MSYQFKEVDPSDYFTSLSTYFKTDFSEVGHFTILDGDIKDGSIGSGKKVNLDLMISNVICTIAEYVQIDPHIGDTFSLHFRGKSPTFVNVSGTLIDTGKNYGKAELIYTYKNVLRMKAVARSGVAPVLIFPGLAFQFAAGELVINESSDYQTTISISMRLAILRLMAFSPYNSGATSALFDSTQSVDVSYLNEPSADATTVAQSSPGYEIVALPDNSFGV